MQSFQKCCEFKDFTVPGTQPDRTQEEKQYNLHGVITHKWGIKMADLMVSDRGLERNIHYLILMLMREGFRARVKCRRKENSNPMSMTIKALDLRTLHAVIFTHSCSHLLLWLSQTILTVNSFVLSHYFTEAWCVNQTVSKRKRKNKRERAHFLQMKKNSSFLQ